MHVTVIVSKDAHRSDPDDEPFVGQQYVENRDDAGQVLSRVVIRYDRFPLLRLGAALRYRSQCRKKAKRDDRLAVRLVLRPIGSISFAMPVPERVGR